MLLKVSWIMFVNCCVMIINCCLYIEIAKEYVTRQYVDFLTRLSCNLDACNEHYEHVTKDISPDPISLNVVPYEEVSLTELVVSDDEMLRKVMLTLGHLVCEMEDLVDEGRSFYYPLLYYAEGLSDGQLERGECHACISKMIPVLEDLLQYVEFCYSLISNTVSQLGILYPDIGPALLELNETHFKIVFERLGELLATLNTIDIILSYNNKLREHVSQFQHIIRSVQHKPSAFDSTFEDLNMLDLFLDQVCEKLLSGTIFLRSISNLDQGPGRALLTEVAANVRGFLHDISGHLEKDSDYENMQILHKFFNTCCLHVLHSHLSGTVDKKQLKTILDHCKVIVAVPLVGPCLWLPEQFLSVYLPKGSKLVDMKCKESIAACRFTYLRNRSSQLIKDVQLWNSQLVTWLCRLPCQPSGQQEFNHQCNLLMQALKSVAEMSAVVRLILNLHLSIQPVINKATVMALFQVIELIKTVDECVRKQLNSVPQSCVYMQQQLARTARQMISTAMKSGKISSGASATLQLANHVLDGPCSRLRLTIARLSLAVNCGRIFTSDQLFNLAGVVQKMELLSKGFAAAITNLADCTMLYWHKTLLATYLAHANEKRVDLNRVRLTLTAMNDCRSTLERVRHAPARNLIDTYDQIVYACVKRHVLDSICANLETELRIQSHWHLSGERNPLKTDLKVVQSDFASVSLPVGGRLVNVRAYVEHYLAETYYNLAAVASQDWAKYAQMRLLAHHLWRIRPIDDRLPSHTVEQGISIIHFLYSLYDHLHNLII